MTTDESRRRQRASAGCCRRASEHERAPLCDKLHEMRWRVHTLQSCGPVALSDAGGWARGRQPTGGSLIRDARLQSV